MSACRSPNAETRQALQLAHDGQDLAEYSDLEELKARFERLRCDQGLTGDVNLGVVLL